MSESVFGGTFARGPVGDLVSGTAWVAALLDVEVALARAAGSVGAVPASSVAAIEQACADHSAYDVGDLAPGRRRLRQRGRARWSHASASGCRLRRPRTCTSEPPARTSWTPPWC